MIFHIGHTGKNIINISNPRLIKTSSIPNCMKDKLITPKEYSKIRHKSLYIYHLKMKNKELVILGSIHTNDQKHSQFKIFKDKFSSLNPEVVFVEGGWENSSIIKLEKDSIKKGEMAFLVFLARKKKIPIVGWEPGMDKEIIYLLKKYSKDELFAHFILRTIRQYVQYRKPRSYLSKQIEEFKSISKWKGYDYSLKHLKEIHQKIFGVKFNPTNANLYNIPPYVAEGDLSLGPSVLNYVASDEMVFRDSFAVKKILKSLNKYKRILVIMGSGHAVVQEPVYRGFFKN